MRCKTIISETTADTQTCPVALFRQGLKDVLEKSISHSPYILLVQNIGYYVVKVLSFFLKWNTKDKSFFQALYFHYAFEVTIQ